MKVENLKPSLLTYYTTRSKLLQPIMAITQINTAIYLMNCSADINQGLMTSTAVAYKQFISLILIFLVGFFLKKIHFKLTCREYLYLFWVGGFGVYLA